MENYPNENGLQVIHDIATVMIIGEIEGHDCISGGCKTTKYEHLIPALIQVAMDEKIKGILFIINTIGGDVSCGLALAELIYSMKKPTVSLIIGDSHSIGVPLSVATDYSFIVPSATVLLHPVRISGTVIGSYQTQHQFEQIQQRIITFILQCSKIKREELERMITNTKMIPKDLGTILVGEEAVRCGLVNECGGIDKAFEKLEELTEKK